MGKIEAEPYLNFPTWGKRMTLQRTLVVALVLAVASCGPMGEDTLDINVVPRTLFDDGQVATVTVVATTAKGTVGSGVVKLTVTAGQLTDSSVTLDQFGTARTTWTCNKSLDAACMGAVQINGTWNGAGGAGKPVEGLATATVGPRTVTGGGTGGGGGMAGRPHFLLEGLLQGNATDQLSSALNREPSGAVSTTAVGFPAHATLTVRNDNAVLYYATSGGALPEGVYLWVEDVLGRMSGGAFDYPDTSGANDMPIQTGCPGFGAVKAFARPDSNRVVYRCGDLANTTAEDGSTLLTGVDVIAAGPQAVVLARKGSGLELINGTTHTPVTIPGGVFGATGTETGFLVASPTATACDLYSVDLSGTATRTGGFATTCVVTGLWPSIIPSDGGALGRDGTFWVLNAHNLTSYAPDGSAGVLHSPMPPLARGSVRADYVFAN